MSTIPIMFGTESGNAEMVADDIATAFQDAGRAAEAVAMEDVDVETLTQHEFVIVVTSTYGEGELPETTAPFHDALLSVGPNLSPLRFAAFGLGDSTYATYNNGIAVVTAAMTSLGAIQVGETGRHDAASGKDLTDVATEWAEKVLADL